MAKLLDGELLKYGDAADQCRQFGLVVGDTIVGREGSGSGSEWWQESRLTLLWLGDSEVVWRVVERTNDSPEWSTPRESVNWTLECRKWRKLPNDGIEPHLPATEKR